MQNCIGGKEKMDQYIRVGEGTPAAPLEDFSHDELEGVVRVSTREFRHILRELEENEILVSEMTDASQEVNLMSAKALVTERGGLLCHAAVFANSVGMPCVVGAEGILDKLKTGDYIRIEKDGSIYLRK
jgi:phosphohistidine swiveling domain-containing protein